MKALYIMPEDIFHIVLDERSKKRITELLGEEPYFATGEQVLKNPEILEDVEILFPSYGTIPMDEKFMSHAKNLKAVLCLLGSIKPIVSKSFWDRKIPIMSAAIENAVPVAEYVLGEIILYLKGFFHHSKTYKEDHDHNIYIDKVAGLYNKKVGLISYGMIAKHLKKLLENFNLEVCVYSPELDKESAAKEGMTYMSLEELFENCDVVSLHTPLLPATVGMLGYEHFSKMKKNSAFINSARGAIIREKEMIQALQERPDITAMLDVTEKEPLEEGNPLFDMENVILTPHIAGATGYEKARLGNLIVQELERFLTGKPMLYTVKETDLNSIA